MISGTSGVAATIKTPNSTKSQEDSDRPTKNQLLSNKIEHNKNTLNGPREKDNKDDARKISFPSLLLT